MVTHGFTDPNMVIEQDIGYFSRGKGMQERWNLLYVPHENLIITNPFVPKEKVDDFILEEFLHSMFLSFRPAQRYPLSDYLAGISPAHTIRCFRDIVETAAIASLALFPDQSSENLLIIKRNADDRYFELAKQILSLMHLYVARSTHTRHDRALSDALTGLLMYLSLIIPDSPRQCHNVLDLLKQMGTPDRWSNTFELVMPLIVKSSRILKTSYDKSRWHFRIDGPIEPHTSVQILLRFATSIIRGRRDSIGAAFCALNTIITMDSTRLTPVLWLTNNGSEILANIEIIDQTDTQMKHKLSIQQDRCKRRSRSVAGVVAVEK